MLDVKLTVAFLCSGSLEVINDCLMLLGGLTLLLWETDLVFGIEQEQLGYGLFHEGGVLETIHDQSKDHTDRFNQSSEFRKHVGNTISKSSDFRLLITDVQVVNTVGWNTTWPDQTGLVGFSVRVENTPELVFLLSS